MSELILLLIVVWVLVGLYAWNYEMRPVPPEEREAFDYLMLGLCLLGGPLALVIVLMDS